MVKISRVTKIQIILSVVLLIAGAIILLSNTAINSGNAWTTIIITGAIVVSGAVNSIKKDKLSKLKPVFIKKY